MRHLPDLPPSHILLPLDRIPDGGHGDPLGDFVAHGTRRWGGDPVPVPDVLTLAFWVVLAANAGFGTWLAAVVFGGAPCDGAPCAVTTWNQPGVVLALATVCVLTLGGLAVRFHGLVEITPAPLAAALVACVCGVIAVAGVVALLLLAIGGAAIAAALLITVIDRF